MGRYIIKIWETESDRDLGLSDIIETNINSIYEAIRKAKKIMSEENYSSLEVQNVAENSTFYYFSQDEEKYFDENIKNAVIQEKINKYGKLFCNDKLINFGYDFYGKVEDIIKDLKDTVEYWKLQDSNSTQSKEIIEFENYTNKIEEQLNKKHSPGDFTHLTFDSLSQFPIEDDAYFILREFEYDYWKKIDDMKLNEVNLKDLMEIYFDFNNAKNLDEYCKNFHFNGSNTSIISKLYNNILEKLGIEFQNVITNTTNSNKYKTIISLGDNNSIQLYSDLKYDIDKMSQNIEEIRKQCLNMTRQEEILELE